MAKDKVIRLRCTEEEHRVWTQVAKDTGMTVSEFVRELLATPTGSRPVLATSFEGAQAFTAVPTPKARMAKLPGVKPEVVYTKTGACDHAGTEFGKLSGVGACPKCGAMITEVKAK